MSVLKTGNGFEIPINSKNLLINGDFQINQRGKTSYKFDVIGKYGIDMWQHRGGTYSQSLTLTPVLNGIKISFPTIIGGGIRQILSIKDFVVGNKYTASVKVDNVIYSGSGLLTDDADSKLINNDKFFVGFYCDEKYVYFTIYFNNGNVNYTISYADLFAGEFVFSHYKQSYDNDLLACRQYVNVIADGVYYNMGIACCYTSEGGYLQLMTRIDLKTRDNFKYEIDGNGVVTYFAVSNGSGNKIIQITNIIYSGNMILIYYDKNTVTVAPNTFGALQTNINTSKIVLSVEP